MNNISKMNRWFYRLLLIILLLGIFISIISDLLVGGYKQSWTGFAAKTLWDWMDLLIIPIVLSLGAILFNYSERKTEHEIANNNLQEIKLKAYFENITGLILHEGLLSSSENSTVRCIARIQTLSVLNGLNGQRKGILLRFLYEAKLIGRDPIIQLAGADFSGLTIQSNFLRKNPSRKMLLYIPGGRDIVHLQGYKKSLTNLSGINLSFTKLVDSDLSWTNLSKANLSNSNLTGASLYSTDLSESDLSQADLHGANLSDVNLTKAILEGTNFTYADLTGANLTSSIIISSAIRDLKWFTFHSKFVEEGVVQSDGDTDFSGARLKGATMPDGNNYSIKEHFSTIYTEDQKYSKIRKSKSKTH